MSITDAPFFLLETCASGTLFGRRLLQVMGLGGFRMSNKMGVSVQLFLLAVGKLAVLKVVWTKSITKVHFGWVFVVEFLQVLTLAVGHPYTTPIMEEYIMLVILRFNAYKDTRPLYQSKISTKH
jgi:hypothetical protein